MNEIREYTDTERQASMFDRNCDWLVSVVMSAHINSRSKGFWDPPPSPARTRCLIHSEIAEALEDLRGGADPAILYLEPSGKPVGFPSEIADVAIRIFDKIGSMFWDPKTESVDGEALRGRLIGPAAGMRGDDMAKLAGGTMDDLLDLLHLKIAQSFRHAPLMLLDDPFDALNICRVIAGKAGFPLRAVIEDKMAYNLTRPFKHGGKAF